MESARGVDNEDIVTVVLGVFERLTCDRDRVYLSHFKDLHVSLLTNDLKLIYSGRTVNIAGCEERTVSLFFEQLCKLCGVGGFTRTLQTAHHDDRRRL